MSDGLRVSKALQRQSPGRTWERFAPYLCVELVPWLLVATVLRLGYKVVPGGIGLLLLPLVNMTVFLAFFMACERLIRLSAGTTVLESLGMDERVKLAWQVIWRLLLLFLGVIYVCFKAGVGKGAAATLWMGFDGLAFPWRQGMLQVWIGLVAILAFAFVLARGIGQAPRYVTILRLVAQHARHLAGAWIAISLFLMVVTFIQSWLSAVLGTAIARFSLAAIETPAFIVYISLFSYLRIWVVVAIITYAFRASYRRRAAVS